VARLLEALTRPGTVQTVLTGNTAANAAVKLDAFDLRPWLDLDVGAYGSDEADRRALVPVALERWNAATAPSTAPASGSSATPPRRRLRPGRRRHCLLVANGFAPRPDLEAAGADHVVDDLTDTDAVLSLLG